MQNITDIVLLDQMISEGALLVLFCGADCAVCQSIRPQLTSMLEQQFPDMQSVYVDCKASPELCAQHGVFSLPVVKVYIEGMIIAEEVRAFSLNQLMQTIEKPYVMWKAS